ncbi:hypothetical protein [Arthrobacter sp. M4]|uniref:hypothetical protein n=1 Tax=Arthrobacter sp. M4 TaxID=218160 RepID=UPI001CDC8D5A|nr:hypothetical protein [Arthrobacter sp. M4]MCA4134303.1 hypothetical protein [Arthrobacter sp. M4]
MTVVTSEYFPAAAVLFSVVLMWIIGLLGGLSLLSGGMPPLATLSWLLFIYAFVVLSPIAGLIAAVDLVRRWWRNRRRKLGQAGA